MSEATRSSTIIGKRSNISIARHSLAFPRISSARGIRPGNLGRNALRVPGLVNVDFSLGKNIYLTEKFKFQIRADFFNGFNHTNLSMLDTNVESARFGRLNSTRGAREIQLNARFSF